MTNDTKKKKKGCGAQCVVVYVCALSKTTKGKREFFRLR